MLLNRIFLKFVSHFSLLTLNVICNELLLLFLRIRLPKTKPCRTWLLCHLLRLFRPAWWRVSCLLFLSTPILLQPGLVNPLLTTVKLRSVTLTSISQSLFESRNCRLFYVLIRIEIRRDLYPITRCNNFLFRLTFSTSLWC